MKRKYIFCLVTIMLFPYLSFSQNKIIISEIFYDTPLYENDNDELPSTHNGEFIELYNPTGQNIDISGYGLYAYPHYMYFKPNTVIRANDYLLVCFHSDKETSVNLVQKDSAFASFRDIFPNAPTDTAKVIFQSQIKLKNTGQSVFLADKKYNEIDRFIYDHPRRIYAHNGHGEVKNLRSVHRVLNGYYTDKPTPGTVDLYTAQNKPYELYADYIAEAQTKLIDTRLPVGNFAGSASVSPIGAANYNIPIDCPDGIAGMKPQVSVQYNSQGETGCIGKGWEIGGFSIISRVANNLQFDQQTRAITFTSEDGFVMDGERLIYKGNGQYVCETNPQLKVTSDGQTFRIVTPEGMVSQYGFANHSSVCLANSADSVVSYKLHKITDTNGNYIEYFYKDFYGENVINKIVYTGNENNGDKGNYTLSFGWVRRKEISRKIVISGKTLQQVSLLSKIYINDDLGELMGFYEFSYLKDDLLDRDMLNIVRKRNAKGEKLNEIVVSWNNEIPRLVEEGPNLKVSDLSGFWTSSDLNVDGISDAMNVSLLKENHGLIKKEKLRITTYSSVATSKGIEFVSHEALQSKPDNFGVTFALNSPIHKYKDIIVPVMEDKYWYLYIYKWTPSGMIKSDLRYQVLMTEYNENSVIATGDFNNDGLDDFTISCGVRDVSGKETNTLFYYIRKLDGTFRIFSFDCYVSEESGSPFGRDIKQLFVTDFDKDGLADLGILTGRGLHLYKNVSVLTKSDPDNVVFAHQIDDYTFSGNLDCVRAGDFNGDGLLDFIYNLNNSRQWRLAINKGNWSFANEDIPLNIISAYEERISDNDNKDAFYVYDFNGDGFSDFVYWDTEYSQVNEKDDKGSLSTYKLRFLQSTGNGFKCVREIENRITVYDPGRNSDIIGDFNGDGVAEYVMNKSGHLIAGLTLPPSKMYYRVSCISGGMNQKVHFEYQSLARNFDKYYQRESVLASYPVRYEQPSLICVRSMTEENPYQKPNKIIYSYKGSKIHDVIGFLGFDGITTLNVLSGITGSTYCEFTPSGILKKKTETKKKGDKLLSDVTQEYTHVNNSDGSRLNYISRATEIDYLTGTQCNTINKYDHATGYLTKQEKKFDDGISSSIENRGFILAKPTVVITMQKSSGGESVSNKTSNSYDQKGNLTQTISYDMSDKSITTCYGDFAATGLPGWKEIKAGDISQRETYKYDYFGRMTEKTDFLGKTTFTYDRQTGNLLTTVTPDGLSQSNVYNSWGDLTLYSDPFGITTYEKAWAIHEDEMPSLIKETEQKRAHNPIVSWYDALERKLKTESRTADNLLLIKINEFDNLGNLNRESAWFDGSLTQNTLYKYDEYNRSMETTDELTGKVTRFSYSGRTVTTSENGKVYTRRLDSQGNVLTSVSPGGTVSFTYNALGLATTITTPGANLGMTYDRAGNRTSIFDRNLGIRYTSQYDAWGNLIYEKDSENNITTLEYDQWGRLANKYIQGELIASYEYETGKNGLGKVSRITGGRSSGYQILGYDRKGQMISTRFGLGDGQDDVEYTYAYNVEGKLVSSTYPTGLTVENKYEKSDLRSVTLNGQPVWSNIQVNARSIRNSYGNGIESVLHYDDYGNLTSIEALRNTSPVLNYQYNFDPVTGLLQGRDLNGIKETYTYDNQQRLTSTVYPDRNDSVEVVEYDGDRIHYKTGCGKYLYKYNQLQAIVPDETTVATLTTDCDSLSYTPFGSIAYIQRGNLHSTFIYGPDEKRLCMKDYRDDKLLKTTYYAGMYEIQIDSLGNRREICYIEAGNDMPAMQVRENGINRLYYLHADHLGSITAVSDDQGNIIARYHYGAWGIRQQVEGEPLELLTRGFTGHEHLSQYGVINMNGRLYDPQLGIFLSQDNFIQQSGNVQNYNRYTYCLNNPLHLTDPSGQIFVADDLLYCAIAAAVVAGTVNVAANWDNIDGFWQGFTSFVVGAGAAVATVYTGGIAGMSWIGIAGVSGICGVANGATNNIIAQTGKNFRGMENVDWNQVGLSGTSAGLSAFVSAGIGYASVTSASFTINGYNVTSPILKTAIYSPVSASAGHITAGMSYGLLSGNSWSESWNNTSKDLIPSVMFSASLSITITVVNSIQHDINPMNGFRLRNPEQYAVKGTQEVVTLSEGMIIDRYGGPEDAYYVSPSGTSFESRSLPPSVKYVRNNAYKVVKPIEVERSIVAPAFRQPGGGIQYKSMITIDELIRFKYLEVIK